MEVGRFLNADDVHYLGEEGISCNLFTYCENTPVNSADPDGCGRKHTIKRSTVANILDAILMSFSALRLAFAPIKSAAKACGKHMGYKLERVLKEKKRPAPSSITTRI